MENVAKSFGKISKLKKTISDEDFVAGSSGSEVAEEYDSEAESSTDTDDRDSGEDEEARRERKRKARDDKLAKKEKKSSSHKVRNTFEINNSEFLRLFGCRLSGFFLFQRKEGGSTRKSKGKRKKKDKNAPKKPMSAYFLWLNDNR